MNRWRNGQRSQLKDLFIKDKVISREQGKAVYHTSKSNGQDLDIMENEQSMKKPEKLTFY